MTRKRFVKLVMAQTSFDRNTAMAFAGLAQKYRKSYDCVYQDMWCGVM